MRAKDDHETILSIPLFSGSFEVPEKKETPRVTSVQIDKSKVKSIETRADGTIVVTDKKGNMATIREDDEKDPAEILKQLDY